MQVRRLAREWGVNETRLIETFMHATRAGLLELSWDVVCPRCRGVREEAKRLGDVEASGHCDVCDVDFSTDAEHAVEVTFRIHSSIRSVPAIFYCSAEPASKEHIKLQLVLDAGETQSVALRLPPGPYRLRSSALDTTHDIDVQEGCAVAEAAWNANGAMTLARVAPEFCLILENNGAATVSVALEAVRWNETALRPQDLFGMQQFHDLFSDECLAAGTQLHVGEQTLLFTDIVGSTRFYAERGDAGAFAEVNRHFAIIQEVLRAHRGALVKSIGDAAMAVFGNPLDAVRASRAIVQRFASDGPSPLRLRVSLNTGRCIAVNLNTGVDYFGSAVNIAAKLQAVVDASEVALADAVWEAPGVARYLEAEAAMLEPGALETQAGDVGYRVWRMSASPARQGRAVPVAGPAPH